MSKTATTAETAATTTAETGKTTTRELRVKAEAMLYDKVTTRAALAEALPILIALQDRIALLSSNLRTCRTIAANLSEACTEYVTQRPSVLEEGKFVANQSGVLVGDVVVDEKTYHIAKGFCGYRRMTGENMSQDFLENLPKDFVKAPLALDITAVNAMNLTADELGKYGLEEKPNNVWSFTPVAEAID